MESEFGQFALILALVVACVQTVVPLYGAWKRSSTFTLVGDYAAFAQLLFVGIAFALLARAFVLSDFSLLVVAQNSNTAMPTHFRFSATWGNHEGSLLLWILILALFGAAVARLAHLPAILKARVLAVQGSISVAFLGLALFTSNPFETLHPVPAEGFGLNPLLQDIGLVLHPPFLYLGYVGFSITFAFAVAALIDGRVDAVWARLVRPWVLAAWVFLTIGIALGSYWAYYELGWGGWWFWDPVENASFMPWLVGTALLHSTIVVERRQTLVKWTLLLAILTFSLSLLGTFIVRSGIITSVHAFVTDPARGLWILAIMIFFTGGALTLFAMRANGFRETAPFQPVSREGGLILNNVLLIVATATVFIGTFYPLFVELTGPEKISVGPPFFNQTFVPLMIPLMMALNIGAFLRWKRDTIKAVLGRLRSVLGLVALAIVGLTFWLGLGFIGTILALGLAAWLVLGAMAIWTSRVHLFGGDAARTWHLTRTMPRGQYGMILAHAGLGLLVAGIACMTAWEEEHIVGVGVNEPIPVRGYVFQLADMRFDTNPNFQSQTGTFLVTKDGAHFAQMRAERRFYPIGERVTTEAAIKPVFLTNLYVSIGDQIAPGQWTVRIYYHPFVLLIWIGPSLMALGGILSLSDRRVRFGLVGGKAERKAKPVTS